MAKGYKTGGRQKGSMNKSTQEQREALAASGLMPLDFLLSVMRDEDNDKQVRMTAAKDAAPYCHQRLAATELSGGLNITKHEDSLDELE